MLVILVGTIAVSIVVGWILRGSISNVATLRLRHASVLYPALALGLIPLLVNLDGLAFGVVIVAAYVLVAFFLVSNALRADGAVRVGMILLLMGWLLNAAPMALNGGMPLSLSAYHRAGLRETPTPRSGGFFKIVIATPQTKGNLLGDAIPISPIHQVVSVGDILLMLGVGVVLVGSMRTSIPEQAKLGSAERGVD
jgi:hypothetical protein